MHDNNNDEIASPKCHPGTRIAYLQPMIKWAQDTESLSLLLWLVGPAGSGKSSIARSLAEELEKIGVLAGTFFFFSTDPLRNTVKGFVATLTHQLALLIPELRPILAQIIFEKPAIFQRSFKTQFKTLIVDSFCKLSASSDFIMSPLVVIIDGLDECSNRTSRCTLLQTIHDALPHLPAHWQIPRCRAVQHECQQG